MSVEEWDPALTRFYAVLGHAITQWAHVEEQLCAVYVAAVRGKPSYVHAAVFYSVTNLNSKLAMVNGALSIQAKRQPDVQEAWGRLAERVSRKAKPRNEMAHFAHILDIRVPRKPVHRLTPPLANPKRWLGKKDPDLGYDLPALEAAAISFYELRADLEAFAEQLQARPQASAPPE